MRQTRGWNGLRTAVFALGLFTWTSSGAEAGALITYQTSGNVMSNVGVTGKSVIDFTSVDPGQGRFTSPSSFSLGSFKVASLGAGETTTYKNTPFSINYIPMVDGVAVANSKAAPITGTLSGSVTGPDQSTVVATFDSATIPDFITGPNTNKLTVNDLTLSLVPSSSNGGRTTAQAYLAAFNTISGAPVPEPTTIALFLTTLAGLGLRQRVRAGRAA